jgi:hypothetical protein
MTSQNQSQPPSEATDVFLHQEGNETGAYHAGKLIARMTRTSQERFYADLHVWVRKTRYSGPYWRVLENGTIEQDHTLADKISQAL